ncbi:hypothetical protein Tco_0326929 [Tanacetum coccineum]
MFNLQNDEFEEKLKAQRIKDQEFLDTFKELCDSVIKKQREERERIAKEKEAEELEAERKKKECLKIENSLSKASTRSRQSHIDPSLKGFKGDLKFFDDLLNENLLPPDVSNVENNFQDNKEEIDISCDMIPPELVTDDDSEGTFSGFWKIHGSILWKDKAMPTISIDGLQSSLHKVGNLLSLSLSN